MTVQYSIGLYWAFFKSSLIVIEKGKWGIIDEKGEKIEQGKGKCKSDWLERNTGKNALSMVKGKPNKEMEMTGSNSDRREIISGIESYWL